MVVTQPVVIAAECGLLPVEPEPVAQEVLPPEPAVADWRYASNGDWAIRARRAELAGIQLEGERDAEREARLTNAGRQTVCANWARSQDQ